MVGSESAIYLDGLGKKVTMVEMQDDWAKDSYWMHKDAMKMYMKNSNIDIHVNTKAKEVTDEGLICITGDEEKLIKADTILVAAGMSSRKDVALSFNNTAPRVSYIGDCMKPGRVAEAVSQGHYKALDI